MTVGWWPTALGVRGNLAGAARERAVARAARVRLGARSSNCSSASEFLAARLMSAGAIGRFDVREEIIARSRANDDLEAIEHDLISPAPVVEDEKAALWLLAWCTQRKA